MALLVWLPLNGNINNQGLSNLKFSNSNTSNTVINTSGKIGSCYLNVGFSGGGLVSNTTINLGQNVSMFCWVKVTQFNASANLSGIISNHHYETSSGIGLTLRYASSTTGYIGITEGHTGGRTYDQIYGNTLLNTNTWYHIGFTYDGNTVTFYLNGNPDGTRTLSNYVPGANYLSIFRWSDTYYSDYEFKGCLNDVRVYNHCLSVDEIHELTLGKIAHYPLNLCLYTNLLYKTLSDGSVWVKLLHHNSPATRLFTAANCGYNNDPDLYSRLSLITDNANIFNGENGHEFYAEQKRTSSSSVETIRWKQSNNPNTVDSAPSNFVNISNCSSQNSGIKRRSSYALLTTHNPSTPSNWYMAMGCYTAWNGGIPGFNEGNPITTGYIDLYARVDNLINTDGGIFNDISGNHYDLTKGGSGNITFGNSTKRYDKSILFNGDSYLNSSFQSHIGTEDFTISCWAKIASASGGSSYQGIVQSKLDSGASAGFGIYYNALLKKLLWSTGDGSSALEKWTNSTVDTILLDNWCHIVMVRNNSDAKKGYFYINGTRYDLAAVPTILNINSNNTISLGRNQGGLYYKGGLSDVRLYATALSADDVLKLYKLGNV